jgi:hypothetical protein
MQKIFNNDGFNWWIGVVEDRMDPEKLGRCRVRVFGYHTDSKDLLPTKDLPWAIPIQPITSAAMSGLGSSPLGPLEGTWVMGFYLDGADMQQPAMLGTIATKAATLSFTPQPPDKSNITNPSDGVSKDNLGNPILDSNGNTVREGTPSVPGWELGKTSETYESGKSGPSAINDYNGGAAGDAGGASYGTYQFASYLPPKMGDGRARRSAANSPVLQFISQSKFKTNFAGLNPATAAFDAKWKEIAAANLDAFKAEQHDYVKRNYYNVAVANLQRTGLDLSKYGPAVQDLIWSSAVQFGPANIKMFTEPLRGKTELTDKDIVNIVSAYKISNVNTFFSSSSPAIQESQKGRYASEKSTLLTLVA